MSNIKEGLNKFLKKDINTLEEENVYIEKKDKSIVERVNKIVLSEDGRQIL